MSNDVSDAPDMKDISSPRFAAFYNWLMDRPLVRRGFDPLRRDTVGQAPHCLTKNLPLSSSQNHLQSKCFPTSATRSPLRSCSLAKGTEVAIMCLLRQIFHEANGGIAVHRAGPPDPGSRLRHEISAAGSSLWQAMCVGRGSQDCSIGIVKNRTVRAAQVRSPMVSW
jgi:hypothetical protein